MTTQKQKFPVLSYPIRGCSLSKAKRISLVRRAMAGTLRPASSAAAKIGAPSSSKILKDK